MLPRRWVVERSFAWMARFRRLARDYERLPETIAGLHVVAFAMLMLQRAAALAVVHNSLYHHLGIFRSGGSWKRCRQCGHRTGGVRCANSRPIMAWRMAGRLGDGGGPGLRVLVFFPPRPAVPGEA